MLLIIIMVVYKFLFDNLSRGKKMDRSIIRIKNKFYFTWLSILVMIFCSIDKKKNQSCKKNSHFVVAFNYSDKIVISYKKVLSKGADLPLKK